MGQPAKTTRVGTGRCSRCGMLWDADVSMPWERAEGWCEWVTVRPHLHGNTQRSTCRPKGYARSVASPTSQLA